MGKTNFAFTPGKLLTILDASAGSSGKGKIGSYICENADNWQFALNTFAPQAGHWVKIKSTGKSYFYQTFNSCAYMTDRYEALYTAPGSIIELPAFFREIEESNIPRHKIKISPLAAILQDIDGAFERGEVDFDGKPVKERHTGTMKTGTTAHGSGACRARRVLRRKEAMYARDIPELKEFICDVPGEVMTRLNKGQAGLLEVAQGFQLSYLLPDMFPYTTSRNCTVMSGLDDAMIPPYYTGNVILNCRTYPIRISNRKYLDKVTGKHLTWAEVKEYETKGVEYEIFEGNSGPGYSDQSEISWEELTKRAESPTPIIEMTSVTKLPRRVFTFSKQNISDAINYNKTNNETFLSINFMNYVDHKITGVTTMTDKASSWLKENLTPYQQKICRFIGTGADLEDQIIL